MHATMMTVLSFEMQKNVHKISVTSELFLWLKNVWAPALFPLLNRSGLPFAVCSTVVEMSRRNNALLHTLLFVISNLLPKPATPADVAAADSCGCRCGAAAVVAVAIAAAAVAVAVAVVVAAAVVAVAVSAAAAAAAKKGATAAAAVSTGGRLRL